MTYSSLPPAPQDNTRLKRRILLAVGAVIVVIIGLFVFRFATAPHGPPGGAGMGVPVLSENPRAETVTGKVDAVGTLHADQSTNIAPEVDGRLAVVSGAEGQAVKKGDLIAQLDQSIPKADMDEANANLALAQSTYGRTRNLATREFATRQSEDEALASLRQMQARAASAKARFDKTSIYAPFNGVLGLRAKSVGAFLKAGDIIFTLSSVDPIYIDFRVPELKSARVQPGQKVTLNIPALGLDTVEGEVTAVDPVLDEAGRSLAVRAKVANPDGKIHAGMFAHVSLSYGEPHNVLIVPERAVFLRADGTYVYRASGGKAELAKVTLGERRVGEVEILDGIAVDDDIITDGQIKLMPGAPVTLLSKPNVPPSEVRNQKSEIRQKENGSPPNTPAAEARPADTKPENPAPAPPEQKPEVKPGTPPEDKPAAPAENFKPAENPLPAFVPAPAVPPPPADEKKE